MTEGQAEPTGASAQQLDHIAVVLLAATVAELSTWRY
jgi:hypothetical protein